MQMPRQWMLAATALILSGCATSPKLGSPVYQYQARGNEPGWTLTIDANSIIYTGNYGSSKIVAPAVTPETNMLGRRYRSGQLDVTIAEIGCIDASDARFADSVTVIAGNETVRGCGGGERTSTSIDLDNTLWRFVAINGVAISGDRPAELRFADGRMSGSAGCNRFSGDYSLEGDMLRTAKLASTLMACTGPNAEQEDAFLKITGRPLLVSFDSKGRLVLNDLFGGSAVLVRAGG